MVRAAPIAAILHPCVHGIHLIPGRNDEGNVVGGNRVGNLSTYRTIALQGQKAVAETWREADSRHQFVVIRLCRAYVRYAESNVIDGTSPPPNPRIVAVSPAGQPVSFNMVSMATPNRQVVILSGRRR